MPDPTLKQLIEWIVRLSEQNEQLMREVQQLKEQRTSAESSATD